MTWPLVVQGPVSPTVFHRNSNSMEILFHSHLDSNKVIAIKFCTWDDSCAVVACAKICCNLRASNGITTFAKFQSNLNCEQKIVSETGPSTGCWNPSSWKTAHLQSTVNTRDADDLAMQGAKTSAAIILTYYPQASRFQHGKGWQLISWQDRLCFVA